MRIDGFTPVLLAAGAAFTLRDAYGLLFLSIPVLLVLVCLLIMRLERSPANRHSGWLALGLVAVVLVALYVMFSGCVFGT